MLDYRLMANSDLLEVFEVRTSTTENAVTMEDLSMDYGVTPKTVEDSLRGSARGWVCSDSGRIVGFSMGDKESGEVTVVAVLPGYEGRGIGKILLNFVGDWLFKSGHKEIWLSATADPGIRAYGFYRALGWKAVESSSTDGEKMVLRRP